MARLIKDFPHPQSRPTAPEYAALVLASWKDIANFLGKGVRTVQRWEKELGLPLRRPTLGGKSAVLAIPSEVNLWVLRRFSGRQSHDGEVGTTELLRQIEELLAENLELRSQLQMLCAKSA